MKVKIYDDCVRVGDIVEYVGKNCTRFEGSNDARLIAVLLSFAMERGVELIADDEWNCEFRPKYLVGATMSL